MTQAGCWRWAGQEGRAREKRQQVEVGRAKREPDSRNRQSRTGSNLGSTCEGPEAESCVLCRSNKKAGKAGSRSGAREEWSLSQVSKITFEILLGITYKALHSRGSKFPDCKGTRQPWRQWLQPWVGPYAWEPWVWVPVCDFRPPFPWKPMW